MASYATIVTVPARRQRIDTSCLFDATYQDAGMSPVDQFVEDTVLLNRHWTGLPNGQEVAPELSRLLLIGYASAVEGYMRALIRKLVHVDPYTSEQCAKHQVSFAAAIHHSRDMLPDALLEEASFSSEGAIAGALSKYIGFGNLTGATRALLDDFEMLMHLRHCCTHRFGKLGVKNATALGLHSHGALLEKPIKLDKTAMETIADLTFTLVKSINNDVFGFVMKRTATTRLPSRDSVGIGWAWHLARDRARFMAYYDIFCSHLDATPSPAADDVYRLFRDEHRRVGARQGAAA
jgi:hypothetical protein